MSSSSSSRVVKSTAPVTGASTTAEDEDQSAQVAALTQEDHENESLNQADSTSPQQPGEEHYQTEGNHPHESAAAAAAAVGVQQYRLQQKTMKLFIAVGLGLIILCAIFSIWFYIMMLPLLFLCFIALLGVMKSHRIARWVLIVFTIIVATLYLIVSTVLILFATRLISIPQIWGLPQMITASVLTAAVQGICSAIILVAVAYITFRLNNSYKKEIAEEAESQYLLGDPAEVKEIIV